MTRSRRLFRTLSAISIALVTASTCFAQNETPTPATQLPEAESTRPSPLQTPPASGQLPIDIENLDIDEETKKILAKILPIDAIRTNMTPPEGELPPDRSKIIFTESAGSYAKREWPVMEFHWEASELVFQPPYWEQTPLERYGQTISPRLQPVLSGLHFFGTFPIIPYKIGIDRPFDRISVLGYYQPGSPTPCLRQRLPFEWDAALMEAGAWAGGVMIFP